MSKEKLLRERTNSAGGSRGKLAGSAVNIQMVVFKASLAGNGGVD